MSPERDERGRTEHENDRPGERSESPSRTEKRALIRSIIERHRQTLERLAR